MSTSSLLSSEDCNDLPVSSIFISLAASIADANREQLITELSKRGLLCSGSLPELKNRLLQYLEGDSTPSDFLALQDLDYSPSPTISIMNTSDTKKPYFKPGTFSGLISDNIHTFLKKYERAAKINSWSDTEKSQFLVAFLEGPAITFYENLETNTGIPAWPELEKLIRQEYEPITNIDMLRSVLEKRKQLDDELTVTYINEAESLCKRINPDMSQDEIVRNIRKGLKPTIARYVGILDNNSVTQLKDNIRKYDTMEFMITGDTSQTHSQTDFFKQHINAITTDYTKQVVNLTNDINLMKTKLEEVDKLQNTDTNAISLYNNPPSYTQNSNPFSTQA